MHCLECSNDIEVNRGYWYGWVSPYEFRQYVCKQCEFEDFKRQYPIGSHRPKGDFSSLGAELSTYAIDRLWREVYGDVEIAGAIK